jgi:hypothetical protein
MADGLMANPYAGLLNLGLSPEQAQAEVDRQRALQFANLNPQQRMAAGIYGGLTQVSRALGAKDPMLEQASQMRAMAQQFDTTTAEGLMQYAQALQQSGNIQAAQAAAMQARQVQTQEAKLGSEQALMQQRLRERAAADPREQFIRARAADYTPDSLQEFARTGDYSKLTVLTKEDKATKPPADFLSTAVELGFGEKTRIGDYSPAQVAQINKKIFDNSVAKATAARPQVNVDTKGPSAFAQELGKEDAKAVVQARTKRDSALSELQTLDRAIGLSNAPVVSGSLADLRLDVLNFLDTAGILGGRPKQQLVNSQQFQKETGDLVLAKIKALGANPSNADREFVAKIVPSLNTSAEARRQLLDYLQKRAQQVVEETSRLEDYAVKNNSLRGYKPKVELIKGGAGPGTTSKGTSYQIVEN